MAGLFGAVAGLVIVYVGGVIAIFLPDQEILGTLLAAVTYLPLMLINVFFFPNLVLGILLGVLLGIINHQRGRLFQFYCGSNSRLLVYGGRVQLYPPFD